MPTLVLFISLATALMVILTFIVLIPWLRVKKLSQNNLLIALNVEIFQDRIKELNTDYQAGRIDKATFTNQKTDLERQLIQASSDDAHIHQVEVSIDAKSSSLGNSHNPKSNPTVAPTTIGDRRSRIIMLVGIPLLTVLSYLLISNISTVNQLWKVQDRLGQVADDLLTGKIEAPPKWAAQDSLALLSAMQTNVYGHAHDPLRWMTLSDILWREFEAPVQSLEAIARAYRLSPSDEAIATRYAQTQFFVNGGMLNTDARAALIGVLQQNPEHQGAQMLMVMGEARNGNYAAANGWLEKLRLGIQARGGDQSVALTSLDKLSQNISEQQHQANQISSISKDSAISIVVKLNPSLVPLIDSSDVLFVTIKPSSGGAPVAAKRIPVTQLLNTVAEGLTVELSDKDAMIATNTISAAQLKKIPLIVTARVSKSGEALSQAGDLTATPVPLVDIKNPMVIHITTQVP